MFKQLLMLLLPPTCVLCGYPSRQSHNLCVPCQQSLPILSHHCQQCAHILAPDTECINCRQSAPPYDRTYALSIYQPPIIRLITALKFRHQLHHAALLGALLAQKIQSDWYVNQPLPDLIVPVPLHPNRLKERGFNQALEIARPISRLLKIPLDRHSLTRSKYTEPQSTLAATARKDNVAHAFTAHRRYDNLTLAVLDDVMTTGHTLTAIGQTLKQAGAKRIDIWCCARAMNKPQKM